MQSSMLLTVQNKGQKVKSQTRLIARYLNGMPEGRVEWIGLRPQRKAPMTVVNEAWAEAGMGLQGDRRMQGRGGSGRQVTITSREFIDMVARQLGVAAIDPALLRRNLVVSGVNLNALRHQRIRIGEVVVETNALCQPCSRMETALGPGALVAMLGYGGLCARILESGRIAVGDPVIYLPPEAE